ncbi:MAG: FeoB-associated Cys-rich membrane protein [Thermodesulfobacteriota bacterium]
MESAIVIVLIALAVMYLVYRKIGGIKGAPPTCGCGCSGCGAAGGCGEPNPHVMRAKAGSARG